MAESVEGREEQSGTKTRSEGVNARLTVNLQFKPRVGKEDLRIKYGVTKYDLQGSFVLSEALKGLVPRNTPEYVERGQKYVERVFRALYHFKQCSMIGPSGTGKSVTEDQFLLIKLNERTVSMRAGEAFRALSAEKPVYWKDNWETTILENGRVLVPSLDEHGKIAWKPALAIMRTRFSGRVASILTKNHRSLVATPEHSFLTLDGTLSADRLKPGMHIPVVRSLPSSGRLRRVRLSEHLSNLKTLGDRVVANGNEGARVSASKSPAVDEESSWFLGFFMAEGNAGGSGIYVTISNSNFKLIRRCIGYMRSIGIYPTVRYVRGLCEIRIRRKALAAFMNAVSLTKVPKVGSGNGSQMLYRRVPDFIFDADKATRLSFLKGFYVGDGWLDGDCGPVLETSSMELAHGLVLLCAGLGMFVSIGVKKTKKGHHYSLGLSWNNAAHFGIPNPLKIGRGNRNRVEKVPITDDLVSVAKTAYEALPASKRSRRLYKRTVDILHVSKYMGIKTLERVAREIGSKRLMELAKSDVIWDRVERVTWEEYSGFVYDFQVPGNENFLAGFGGVITHNTHVAYLVAEIAGLPMWEINCSLQTSVYDLFGRFVGLGKENWVDGQIVSWCRYGGILYLDEANMMKQDVATRLNPILDTRGHMVLTERDNEVIPRHPQGYVIISMNPYSAEFAGTKPMNAAFRRRMSVWIDFDYLSVGSKIGQEEVEMVSKRGRVSTGTSEQMVRVAAEMRRRYKAGDLPYAPSVGDLINWGVLISDGLSPLDAAEETIISVASDDSEVQNVIRRITRMVFGEGTAT